MAIFVRKRKKGGIMILYLGWIIAAFLAGTFAWKMAEKAKDEAARAIRQAEYLQRYELCGDFAACASRAANHRPQCKWGDGKNMGG
jgi:hypothetical protein